MRAVLLTIIIFLFLTPLFIDTDKAETKSQLGIEKAEPDMEATIKDHCQSEWPVNLKIRNYCEELQHEGVRTLNKGKPTDIEDAEFNIIRDQCKKEWPTDYQMRAYCEKEQYKGVRTLNNERPIEIEESEFNMIRDQCKKEWPTDYQMRANC
jgi:hypothetical protein